MNSKHFIYIVICFSLSTGLYFLAGCAQPIGTVAESTDAPALKDLSKEQLKTTMGQLLEQVLLLDSILLAPPEIDANPSANQTAIVQALTDIEDIANQLNTNLIGSNHAFLVPQLDEFRSRVDNAKLAASQTPPSYSLVEHVIDGCARCHTINL